MVFQVEGTSDQGDFGANLRRCECGVAVMLWCGGSGGGWAHELGVVCMDSGARLSSEVSIPQAAGALKRFPAGADGV